MMVMADLSQTIMSDQLAAGRSRAGLAGPLWCSETERAGEPGSHGCTWGWHPGSHCTSSSWAQGFLVACLYWLDLIHPEAGGSSKRWYIASTHSQPKDTAICLGGVLQEMIIRWESNCMEPCLISIWPVSLFQQQSWTLEPLAHLQQKQDRDNKCDVSLVNSDRVHRTLKGSVVSASRSVLHWRHAWYVVLVYVCVFVSRLMK